MSMVKQHILIIMLAVLLIGLAGHAFAPDSKVYHAVSESTCAFHAGILAPAISQQNHIEA